MCTQTNYSQTLRVWWSDYFWVQWRMKRYLKHLLASWWDPHISWTDDSLCLCADGSGVDHRRERGVGCSRRHPLGRLQLRQQSCKFVPNRASTRCLYIDWGVEQCCFFVMADGDTYLLYTSNGSCTMSLLWQNKPWQGDQD